MDIFDDVYVDSDLREVPMEYEGISIILIERVFLTIKFIFDHA